jgi:hypothetical protein
MNSDEINKLISKLDNTKPPIYESCIGEKLIPYIGWSWRNVDFDADCISLGVIPAFEGGDYAESNDCPKVGFMQNNKWGYDEFTIMGDQWKTIKRLITTALEKRDGASFEAVDLYLQSLLPRECKQHAI